MRRLVEHAATCFPDRAFFLCTDEKLPSVTGAELYGLCKRAAAVLDGFDETRHIALLGPSSAAWLAAFFSVLSAGRAIVPLHDGMQRQELEDCLMLSDCGLLLYDERRGETASALARAVPGLRLLEVHDFIGMLRRQERETLPELEPEAVAAMYFTSGTTGKPRCVMLTHRNMGSQVSAVTEMIPLSETDVGLSLLPLSHTFEMMTYVAGALHCGGTLYLNESVRTVKKNLREKRPTILVAVPLILQTLRKEILNTARKQGRLEEFQKALRLNRRLQKVGLDMSGRLFGEVRAVLGGRLHTVICGGAALDTELIGFFQALGIEVLQGYGITECSPIVSVNRQGKNVVGSVGRPLPCCEVKIKDREICVRGENVSPGYYKDAQATAASFRDGWFHTGDLGRLDQKGNEILSACSSFYGTLNAQGLQNGTEQEYVAIRPERSGLVSCSTHEILGKRDETQIRLEHRTPPGLNTENLAETLDAAVTVRYNGEDVISEELHASDFETVYAQLNRLFSKCHHREKAYFGLKGRVRFFNSPSMVGLFLLTISHSGVSGLFPRAWKIEKILHWLQTGYGKNPCKGFGG